VRVANEKLTFVQQAREISVKVVHTTQGRSETPWETNQEKGATLIDFGKGSKVGWGGVAPYLGKSTAIEIKWGAEISIIRRDNRIEL